MHKQVEPMWAYTIVSDGAHCSNASCIFMPWPIQVLAWVPHGCPLILSLMYTHALANARESECKTPIKRATWSQPQHQALKGLPDRLRTSLTLVQRRLRAESCIPAVSQECLQEPSVLLTSSARQRHMLAAEKGWATPLSDKADWDRLSRGW